MNVLYQRDVATATTHQSNVMIPPNVKVVRVEAHVLTLPIVALGTPDTATMDIRVCSIVPDEDNQASTWLFGRETAIGFQPVVWQGELFIKRQSHVYLDVDTCVVGDQIELAVTIEDGLK